MKNKSTCILFLFLFGFAAAFFNGCVSTENEYDVKLHMLEDSLIDGCYMRFLLTVGDSEIYFDGVCEVDRKEDYTLDVVDLTGDGVADIAVIFTAFHGTGAFIQEAHIFDGITFERYEVRNAVDLAHGHLGLSADEKAYYINTGIDTFAINKADTYSSIYSQSFALPFFGLICEYKVQDGHLYAYLPIQVGVSEYYGRIEVLYKFDSSCFDLGGITVDGKNAPLPLQATQKNASGRSTSDILTTEKMAEYLQYYGFLENIDGECDYGRNVTRLEAVTIAVRLVNCEGYALTADWGSGDTIAHGYSDVPEWASGYVSCALSIGLLKDDGNALFGSGSNITAREFVVLLLRALDYNDTFWHFDPESPWRLSDRIGLTHGQYANPGDFTFEDVVKLSFSALCTNMKNQSMTMYEYYFVYRRLPEFYLPDVFLARTANFLAIDKWDSYRETYVGGKRGGSIGYSGEEALSLAVEISDPSVVSFELAEVYTDSDHISQNFEVTGLKTGRATIEITFAEGQGDPRSVAFVDVFVFDEIWPGYPVEFHE